jgi:type IV pilus assembly protein PilY1
MYIGRMLINGSEKWVGFIGGGHNLSNLTICAGDPTAADCDKRGKGLFAIDLANGSVLWSITHLTEGSMEYAFPASPALLDSDRDGFIDRAYIGDLGGNMWRLKFCKPSDGSTCNTANWTVNRLFNGSGTSSSARPIYNIAAIAKDGASNIWVYWGTGDKVNSTDTTQRDLFVAMKDTDSVSTRTISNLQDVSADGSVYNDPAKYGWYVQMPAGTGEKILAEPTVFGGAVWFTSWVPPVGTDPCGQAGTSNLYGLDFGNGSAGIDNGSGGKQRSLSLGAGMATAPTFSLNPNGGSDIYLTQSGSTGSTTSHGGGSVPVPQCVGDTCHLNGPGGAGGANRILYWRDTRLNP